MSTRGFTLIELFIVICILSFIALAVVLVGAAVISFIDDSCVIQARKECSALDYEPEKCRVHICNECETIKHCM